MISFCILPDRNTICNGYIVPFVIHDETSVILFPSGSLWLRPNPVYNKFYEHNPHKMKYNDVFPTSFMSHGTEYKYAFFVKQGNGDIDASVTNCLMEAKKKAITKAYLPLFLMGNSNISDETIVRLMINAAEAFEKNNAVSMQIYFALNERQYTEHRDIFMTKDIPFSGVWNPAIKALVA